MGGGVIIDVIQHGERPGREDQLASLGYEELLIYGADLWMASGYTEI